MYLKDENWVAHEILRIRHINDMRAYHQSLEDFERKDEEVSVGDITLEGDSYDIDKDHFEEVMT